MVENTQRIVWVLGSGFSVPLGGPMLKDLLSVRLHNDVARRYASEGLDAEEMRDVLRLYHYGRQFPEGAEGWLKPGEDATNKLGELLWEHAEDFLDTLDTCAGDPREPFGQHLQTTLKGTYYARARGKEPATLQQLSHAARKHIAAECCSFLDRNSAAKERWRPYARWQSALVSRSDTVITFNYDCVLEKLNESGETFDIISRFGEPTAIAQAYKLHGSTSWTGSTEGQPGHERLVITEGSRTSALQCNHSELLIATPGPNKTNAATLLRPWWDAAQKRLEAADAVVFMGYRFPPSDSDARSELLRALAKNTSQHLTLHVVLGPRLDDDVARLEQMLRYSMGGRDDYSGPHLPRDKPSYRLRVHRLYAQDFMSLVSRNQLFHR
jgi:hypothetical protein